MTATDALVVDAFVSAGMLAAQTGCARVAAESFAARLLAEGHADALREVTAAFWTASDGRKAHRDRWAAYERCSLDKTGQEPPPPPPPPDPEPAPQPDPQPTEPSQ